MKHTFNYLIRLAFIFGAFLFASCEKLGDIIHHNQPEHSKGLVYTTSNEKERNSILVFSQNANGRLTYKTTVKSGGAGAGMGLGSQGALIMDKNNKWMYTVNAGNNTISSFKVANDGSLSLHQTISSGGIMPVSLTSHHSRLYVVNGGGNICGFNIASNGWLTKIEGSSQPLSAPNAGPAEILFKPDGSVLVVTEKATNKILTYRVNESGVAQPPAVHDAQAETPFGFVFAGNENIIVTDAFGGRPRESVVTSFSVSGKHLTLQSYEAIYQAAACWVVLTKKEDYAFVTNTASNSISSLQVMSNGKLHLVDSVAAKTGNAPTDICLSGNGKFVYNVNEKSQTIGQYQIISSGRLQAIGEVSGLSPFSVGLAAF